MSDSDITAEIWWDREIVTPELQWLGDEMCRRTGRPADAAGDKGNTAHLRGSHRSQEWILKSAFCTNRTYTVQAGLTAAQLLHIAGFDFTPGSVQQMIAQCQRILAAMKAGLLDEVREFYGNVDGDQVVDGWNNLEDRAATSDSSHLWHWHLGLDRRQMTNRALMERIVAIAMGDNMTDVNLSRGTRRKPAAVGNRDSGTQLDDTWAHEVLGVSAYDGAKSERTKHLDRIEAAIGELAPATAQDIAAALVANPVFVDALKFPSAAEIASELIRQLSAAQPGS